MIVARMASVAEVVELQSLACWALANMCHHYGAFGDPRVAWRARLLVELTRSLTCLMPLSPFSLFASLCGDRLPGKNGHLVVEAGGHEQAVAALQRHPAEEGMTHYACLLLKTLALNDRRSISVHAVGFRAWARSRVSLADCGGRGYCPPCRCCGGCRRCGRCAGPLPVQRTGAAASRSLAALPGEARTPPPPPGDCLLGRTTCGVVSVC